MKKNVLRKDFIIEIKKTMGRFVSIFFIVALGVAFYSGIRASEPSMRFTADQYFDDSKLMDLKVMGTMGLTKADIKAIGKVSGIEAVEGGYSKDVLCPVGDNEKVVHMLSMQKNFDQVSLVEGRLPEKAGECLVDEDFLSYTDLKVGDTVTFHSGDGEALTAKDIVNDYSESELYRIIRDYGEDRFAKNIAKHIVAARAKKPIETTGELTAIIRASIPMKVQSTGGHPAKRTFQAIRIELNRELEVLSDTLDEMIDLLEEDGRICIITFHSLEDRIVKTIFRKNENPCTCPPDFPVCVCGKKSKGKVITRKPILPSDEEMETNPRSKSAKLRIFERRI